MSCCVRQSEFLAEDMGAFKIGERCLKIAPFFCLVGSLKFHAKEVLQFTVH
jgi:hypothetical protein|tara:strand:+ start:35393 stop:35545 length:153 start_codon:yes stop_codon:yes gene_type:complete